MNFVLHLLFLGAYAFLNYKSMVKFMQTCTRYKQEHFIVLYFWLLYFK